MILQARCGRKCQGPCRINFEFPDGTLEIPVTYATSVPGVTQVQQTPVKQSAPYLIWCTAHKEPMRFKALRASRGSDPCGPDCREAEGATCKCQCAGMNHGVDV